MLESSANFSCVKPFASRHMRIFLPKCREEEKDCGRDGARKNARVNTGAGYQRYVRHQRPVFEYNKIKGIFLVFIHDL